MNTCRKDNLRLRLLFSLSVALLLISGPTHATEQMAIFGPETYVRETGKPKKISKSFYAPQIYEECNILVKNTEGRNGKVASAVITLNGVTVVGPNDLNKNVSDVKKIVNIQPQNDLEVEVRGDPGSKLVVTIFANVYAGSPVRGLTVFPDGFPVNTPTPVTFSLMNPYTPSGPVPLIEIQQISPSGEVINVEGVMVDDGDPAMADEFAGDGYFSFRKIYEFSEPTRIKLRVQVTQDGQVKNSEPFDLFTFVPITAEEADQINEILDTGQQLYRQLLSKKSKEKALAEVVSFLKERPFVSDCGISLGGIWIKFANGMEGIISTNPPDTRGGASDPLSRIFSPSPSVPIQIPYGTPVDDPGNINVSNKKVLIMSPFLHEFGSTDEGADLKALYDRQNCPKYDGIGGRPVYLSNSDAGVGAFKALGSYGVVHIASHGITAENNEIVIGTGTSTALQNLKTYQRDLNSNPKRLRPIDTNSGRWVAATPEFFRWYIKSFPTNSIVYFSSCFSMANDTMWKVLSAAGLKTFFGFTNSVPSTFAYSKAKYFHENWVEDSSKLVSTGEIFNGGCAAGACWSMAGAANLAAPPSNELQDGDFETGALGAWKAEGDGRIIPQLGPIPPIDGGFLGVVSTGLGFTTTSGSMEQKICLPNTAQKLEFKWNFNSDEFVEWCGWGFNDTFRVDLITDNGTQNLFLRGVDDLCGMVTPTTLQFEESKPGCIPYPSDVGLGTGGNDCKVWSTDWQSQSIDIAETASANKGGLVTLKFSAGDVGDSYFDSAILLDDIRITVPE